eukprot:2234722-Rhodomonas_salina.2
MQQHPGKHLRQSLNNPSLSVVTSFVCLTPFINLKGSRQNVLALAPSRILHCGALSCCQLSCASAPETYASLQ